MQSADCQSKNNSSQQILPNLPEMFKFVAIINLIKHLQTGLWEKSKLPLTDSGVLAA
jgi:hypothetical protein